MVTPMTFPDWFTVRIPSFSAHLSNLAGVPNVQALQVGAYTGDASVWLLDNILTGPGARLIDVDPWTGTANEGIHGALDWGEVYDHYRSRTRGRRVLSVRLGSDQFFDMMVPGPNIFDFVYVDGDHRTEQVKRDILNADRVLKIGGILGLDDYVWNAGHDDVPKHAIDWFFAEHGERYVVLEHSVQVWARRIA